MTENTDRINQLLDKLEALSKRQNDFSREIYALRDEINKLRIEKTTKSFEDKIEEKIEHPFFNEPVEIEKEARVMAPHSSPSKSFDVRPTYSAQRSKTSPKVKSDIEKFIGENLTNKIGIAITVIGVAIGAKYSIEHQLISPLTRIILGYLMGVGLLGFGIKLKKNYKNYSAVLVSGAIAIMYFITYSAYSFYDLIPQTLAFGWMVIFTAFAVIAAIQYDRQVIAHIGLVGAYAVPFLLSDGSGKVVILFGYMAIINTGILFIAFRKYWKPLYYSSFIVTWLIFFLWFVTKYKVTEHFGLSLTFLSIFFVTFYLIFLGNKLLRKEKFEAGDILLLLANSFVFYGTGYAILDTHATAGQLLGVFTLGNAVVHFGVSSVIYRQKLADKNVFFLVMGLVLVFVTIAIPVQLDGNWVTLLWAGEAALLFWIGRSKNVPVYERLSYPLMLLAFISIIQDWSAFYYSFYSNQEGIKFTPFINIHFLTSLLFVVSFGFINYLNHKKTISSPLLSQKSLAQLLSVFIPVILLIALYWGFRLEISTYWNHLYSGSVVEIKKAGQDYPDMYWNEDLTSFKSIWVINYSLLFCAVLAMVNIRKIRNRYLGLLNLALSVIAMSVFLIQGLYCLSELRDSYLNQTLSEYYHRGGFNVGIRYISFVFAGILLFSIYKYIHQEFLKPVALNLKVAFDLLFYLSLLWIVSSELITWLDMQKFAQSYKLGLSVLWGIYALLLIVLGIWKEKKHLRIGAIALFTVTLIKLFFYDISHLDTVAKTIVFVSLGILLLIISFLYNKYKPVVSDEIER
jgi:uncharacterized membrane protein